MQSNRSHSEHGEADELKPPSWMDYQRYKKGQEVYEKFSFNIYFSMLLALLVGLSVLELLFPLMFTKKSNTPMKSANRYFHTSEHIRSWYEGDIFDKNDKAHKSVMQVRKMHEHVKVALTKDKEESKRPWMRDIDFAFTQVGFVVGLVKYPQHFGMKVTSEEMDGLIFFWRCIGYAMGISDELNTCASYEKVMSVIKDFTENYLKPSLTNPSDDFERMSQVLIDGLTMYSFIPSRNALIKYVTHIIGAEYPSSSTYPKFKMTTRDHIWYMWILILWNFAIWVPGFNQLLNRRLKRRININRVKISEMMKKYQQQEQEELKTHQQHHQHHQQQQGDVDESHDNGGSSKKNN
eukprot:TRINITY_DN8892_c0_g1_i1.p1 TRINITY_DN8892_c0_g1~~TRINITY_DN8892_c0_g1_i1.p1  ORF type:complete len:350 (+),score=51.39 TRINITY_DN8892_c0_g1_i1:21-1070(+)